MKRSLVVAVLNCIVLAGCNKGASSPASVAPPSGPTNAEVSSAQPSPSAASTNKPDEDAIREAVRQHLAGNHGINMSAMNMDITQISINGDQAQADVEFRLKQGGTTMNMSYGLIRHAGGWLVTKSQPGGGQFAHPPMDKDHVMGASGAAPAASADGAPAMPDVHDFFKNNPAPQAAKH